MSHTTEVVREITPAMTAAATLADLDAGMVKSELSRAGALLLRGFPATREDFRSFSTRLSRGFVPHLNFEREKFGDRTLTSVTPGREHFFAHSEMGYTPLRPQVAWFYCEQPAASGGETTVSDGIGVLQSLTDRTRAVFETRRLLFEQALPAEAWQEWSADAQALERLLAGFRDEGFSYELDATLCLRTRFKVSAIRSTPHGPAFCNSLLDCAVPRFEDGEPVAKAVLYEIIAATEELSIPIRWQPHDVLMLDNERFMHGRRKFSDPNRKILVRFANL